MIKLYYVEGISLLDTPYFSNINEQEEYFENKLVKTIQDNSFYPPYYRNQISIDSEDATFLTQFNYVSLEYQNKVYYYFIESISYDNEDLITLNILMDTIQTYMFNINFINSEIDKRLINRYKYYELLGVSDYYINRDYIRENLSQGIKYIGEQYTIDRSYMSFIIVESRDELRYIDSDNNVAPSTWGSYTGVKYDNGTISTNTRLYIIPYIFDRNKVEFNYIEFYCAGTKHRMPIDQVDGFLSRCMSDNRVLNIYDVPINFLEGIEYEIKQYENITALYYTFDNNYYVTSKTWINKVSDEVTWCMVQLKDVPATILENTMKCKTNIGEDYIINRTLNTSFNIKYIPQLIDENYMEIRYGERLGYTAYPLSKIRTGILRGWSQYDYCSGARIHWLTEYSDYNYDFYLTKITNETIEQYATYNDAWKTYQSQNISTLTRGKSLARQNAVYNFASSISGIGSTRQIGETTKINRSNIDRQVTSINKSMQYGTIYDPRQAIGATTDLIRDLYNIDRQYQITRENLQFEPDTIKQGNNMTSDLLNKSTLIYYDWQYVSDLEDVGKLLESYGYRVHEIYTSNILVELNTRYYYNIIKCNNINITLNILNDENTLLNIKDRFLNGIRTWNYNTETRDTYLPLGKVCYYDNVEKEYIE